MLKLLRTSHESWPIHQALGALYALIIVGIVTALIGATLLVYRVEHVTILYLIPVLVAALFWGIIPAVIAAVAGVAAPAYFFYPPIFDFRVQNHDQLIDLVLFVIVAVVTGQLAVTARRAKLRAQADALREALIGSVSHELHTPLAAIVGSASILAQAQVVAGDDQLAALVRVVRHEADRLNADIQNLLDATRISNEGVRPHPEWADLEDIISGALARKRARLGDRPVALSVADDLPLVYVDPSMIESALGQLIENAAKYSPADQPIAISAAQDGGAISIKVVDQGAGLAFGEPEKVFQRFYRSPRTAGVVPGSGLGLWIARALVEACGGQVRAFSLGAGHGTTLRIDLPVTTQPSAEGADE